jgi:tetratricopeptide (TPR) repeat protein
MIVRDEERMLPRFLAQARGLWDELIAVDTGSLDATPTLLREGGAEVFHEPWREDFSAARNFGLERATGDFIVVLDADEMVPESLSTALRKAAGDPGVGAATVLMRNQLPHGRAQEARLLRAFRRDLGLRFRHPIHEDVSEEALALIPKRGLRLEHLHEVVEHLGYVRSHAADKGKKARDVLLLRKLIASAPSDLYAHFKLLEQARFWRDLPLWTEAAMNAAAALETNAAQLGSAHYAGELLALVADGLHRNESVLALRWMDRLRARVAPSAALHLRRGELLEAIAHPAAAAEFERAMQLAPENVRPRLGLFRLALAKGDLAKANGQLQLALLLAPRDPEALFGAIALARMSGGDAAARAFVQQHARAHGDSPELRAAEQELLAKP